MRGTRTQFAALLGEYVSEAFERRYGSNQHIGSGQGPSMTLIRASVTWGMDFLMMPARPLVLARGHLRCAMLAFASMLMMKI